jgi:transaldolase
VGTARSTERDDQGAGDDGGVGGDRGADPPGHQLNVTLLFSVERYEQVIDAYIRGLAGRAQDGGRVDTISSVASFFLSRIDAKVDRWLPASSPLRGQAAIASARVAYQRYLTKFSGPEWEQLAGGKRQRLLWASIGTKNPRYSDVRYVSELVGSDVVNTLPEPTLRAFADHGRVEAISSSSAVRLTELWPSLWQ